MLDNEKKQQKINALRCLLDEKDKKFQKDRLKRATETIIVFAIFYFFILYLIFEWGFGDSLAVAPIFSIIHFVISAPVFDTLSSKSRAEDELIKQIEKSIRLLEESK